jgi:hypothetical protein
MFFFFFYFSSFVGKLWRTIGRREGIGGNRRRRNFKESKGVGGLGGRNFKESIAPPLES